MEFDGIYMGKARIVLCRQGTVQRKKKKIPLTLIGGRILADFPSTNSWELWDGDIQLIPKKKHTDYKWRGASIEDILVDEFGNTKNWGKELKL